MTTNAFAIYFSQLRTEKRMTMRQFCAENALDPAYISKLERGLVPPPSEKVLEKLAVALRLKKDSPEWNKFFSLAATLAGRIPAKTRSNKQLMNELPVLFMALDKKKPSAAKLRQIIKLVEES